MRTRLLIAAILMSGLFLSPLVSAQEPSGNPAVVNPPRYSTAPPARAQARAQAAYAVPPELTLPAGSLITVRLTEQLSSDRNLPGDGFTAVLEQPLVAQGWVLAGRGQTVVGLVAAAQKAGRVQGVSQLAVELSELVLVDGRQVPIRTQLIRTSAGTSKARDAAAIGTTSGMGAAIGGAAGGGQGAAIGAAAGAFAGLIGVLSTRGRPTELYPETILTFRLEDPIAISTQPGQQAFRPVSRGDYANAEGQRNPQRGYPVVVTYPVPAPYYPPRYYYPPYGYYGYYGFGSGIVIAPRVVIGGWGYYRYHP